ncbi:site-specific integrase [Streptomyces sp. NBC_01288]|uniref:hypothetical protein n=1 Tax=Streptomyces sp. NBC_01288 TaxID=2903814 RepID=UPI002E1353C0|nr:site-specific integrase [Streptomyces sp. NBC_01288]
MPVEVMEEEWLLSAEQALLPREARALRVSDVVLPASGGGKLTACRNGMVREIPLQPHSFEFLRDWISDAGLMENDLLFPGRRGGLRSASDYKQIWEAGPRGRPAAG